MITRYIVGDITETELKYIAHGCNCQNKMGSGVAKALYTKFPEVKRRYHDACAFFVNDFNMLGQVSTASVGNGIYVFNCYTQLNFGYDGKKYVNYGAVAKCFERLAKELEGKTIAIPKIGCGLAGGNWTFMEQLINDTVGDKLEIWVYELEEKKNGKNDLG